MIDVKFVPVTRWPKPPTPESEQREGKFRASYGDTIELLEVELRNLEATNIVVQAYFRQVDIGPYGWPRRSADPTQSGVILSFDVRKWDAVKRAWSITELSFPCDTFVAYDDNLRAIALVLEALRKIDRYGVTPGHEQYRGFTALPPSSSEPVSNTNGKMSREDAAEFVAKYSGLTMDVLYRFPARYLNDAYRRAAGVLHPDNKVTGNHELFVRLQRAKEVLEGR